MLSYVYKHIKTVPMNYPKVRKLVLNMAIVYIQRIN